METHYETTRPGTAENNGRPGNKHTGTPNNGQGTQQGQGNRQQEQLEKWLLASPTPNIEAVRDPLWPRPDGEATDGILRVGFQNIRGVDFNRGLGLAPELDAMNEIEADIQGMAEANKPWNSRNKAKYQIKLDLMYNRSTAIYSSAPADHDCTYQPGGTMCIMSGHSAGIFLTSGGDRMGRFCWYTVQGKRDEGIIFITAYQVCNDPNSGPLTAHQEQYMTLRNEGFHKPDPRKDVLETFFS